MAAPRFLCKTELAGLSRVPFAGRPVLAEHERLRAAIGERAPGAAGLLAEPVASASAISWYAEGNGEAVPLTALSPARRAEAERQLGAAVAALQPLLDDPDLGPLVRRALVLPEADRIMLLDERPVLTGWGLAPPERAETAAGLAEQVRLVLGRHIPQLSGTDSTFFAAMGASAAGSATPPAITPAPAVAPVPAAAMPSSASVPPPPPVPPPQAAGPVPSGGAGEGGRGWWMLPSALAIAFVFLVLGFLLAWRIAIQSGGQTLQAGLLDETRTRAQIEMQRQTNAALQAEIARAREALQGDICRPTAPLSPGQVPPALTPVPPGALPPAAPALPDGAAPPGQPGQPPGQQGQAGPAAAPPARAEPFRGNLAQLLDQAVVLIIGFGEQFRGHGTGFFIAPGLILTNAHVARPDARLFVLNRNFPRPLQAEIVASTRETTGEPEPLSKDFALLRVQGAPALQPLGLTAVVEKLQDVVAAGFPAQIVEVEAGMNALLQGQMAPIPDLVLTTGVISAIQHAPTGLAVMPHTASVSPGNSGGPLVDRCGRVVGINTFVRSAEGAADRVNYAQKSEEALAFLQATGALSITPLTGACTPEPPAAQALPAQPPGAAPPAPEATPPPGAEPPAGRAAPPAPPAAPR